MANRGTYPFSQLRSFVAPNAGAGFAIVAPGQGSWRVTSLRFRFVTSAVVNNRTVTIDIDDGQTEGFRASASAVQAAGATTRYSAFAGAAAGGLAAGGLSIPLPSDGALLLPGWRLAVTADLLDVGDQFDQIGAIIEEYPIGPDYEYVSTVDSERRERP